MIKQTSSAFELRRYKGIGRKLHSVGICCRLCALNHAGSTGDYFSKIANPPEKFTCFFCKRDYEIGG